MLVLTSANYRRHWRHFYCVVMLGAGRRRVGLLNIGSHRPNLRGVGLLTIGNRRSSLCGVARLNIGNRLNEPPQCRLNFA
jgi:hypothetical protein